MSEARVRASVRRVAAIARHEALMLANDPMPLVMLIVMPIALMAFFKTAMRGALVSAGYRDANGAEQVVPGAAVFAGFFLPGIIGVSFIREHGWQTWERLQSTPLRGWELITGKIAPWFVIGLVHQFVVIMLGVTVFGLRIDGAAFPTAVLCACLVVFLVSFAVLLVTLAKTVQQANAMANLGSSLLAGIGGALTPVFALPRVLQHIAPVVPTYWAMRGFRSLFLDHGGIGAVTLPCVVLLAAAVGCTLLVLRRFRFDAVKMSWA